jgi:hypothetical protein
MFIEKTVRRTTILFDYLTNTLRDVNHLINCETHRPADDVEAISFEMTFNRITYLRYMVGYDSPIFICVQSGDIDGTRALLETGMATIHDIDPYNLGLLYVRKSI